MELDERVMDKILADVKEIVAEADGTLRFIFYSPYSEETYEDSEIESKDEIIKELESEIKRLRSINNSNITEIKELKYKIISKEEYVTNLMTDINSKDATIKLLEGKLAGGKND